MTVLNVHARHIAASVDDVGALLDGLGGPDDRLWPIEAWPTTPLTIERPLRTGAVSRQGAFSQVVDEYVPGRRISFTIAPGQPLSGTHRFDVEADGAGTRLQHTLTLRAAPWVRPVIPIFLRQHDAMVEDIFDRAELATTGRLVRPSRHPPVVRAVNAVERLALLARSRAPDQARRVDVTDPVAAARIHDYADAFELRLEGPDPCSPEEWLRAGIDATPAWIKRIAGHSGEGFGSARIVASDDQVVVLEDADALMETVLIARNAGPQRRVFTTVLRYRRPLLARAIWAVVGIVHRRTARRVVAAGLG